MTEAKPKILSILPVTEKGRQHLCWRMKVKETVQTELCLKGNYRPDFEKPTGKNKMQNMLLIILEFITWSSNTLDLLG